MSNKLPMDEAISRMVKKHCNKYTYPNLEYTNVHSIINIHCPEHGLFKQQLWNHICGQGCPKCARSNMHQLQPRTKKVFIEYARKMHGDKYIYMIIYYIPMLKLK